MLNASVDMLKHLGHMQHAAAIETAIYETLVTDKIHTRGKIQGILLNHILMRFISRSWWHCIVY